MSLVSDLKKRLQQQQQSQGAGGTLPSPRLRHSPSPLTPPTQSKPPPLPKATNKPIRQALRSPSTQDTALKSPPALPNTKRPTGAPTLPIHSPPPSPSRPPQLPPVNKPSIPFTPRPTSSPSRPTPPPPEPSRPFSSAVPSHPVEFNPELEDGEDIYEIDDTDTPSPTAHQPNGGMFPPPSSSDGSTQQLNTDFRYELDNIHDVSLLFNLVLTYSIIGMKYLLILSSTFSIATLYSNLSPTFPTLPYPTLFLPYHTLPSPIPIPPSPHMILYCNTAGCPSPDFKSGCNPSSKSLRFLFSPYNHYSYISI